MRILLVMEEVKCGGAELSFFALCRALSRRCEVHLTLSQGSLDNPILRARCDALGDTSVRIHRCKTPLNPGTFTNLHRSLRESAASELASVIEAIRPDVVVVNLPTVERGQAVVDAADLCDPRPPVWGFLHLSQRPSIIGAKLGPVRNLLVPKLIRRFDRLMTVSDAGAQEIVQRYGMTRPDVVQPPTETLKPLPPGADRPRLREGQGLPDTFLLGMVGRIQIHHKGQDVALRLVRQLLREGHSLQLVIVGDGPDRQRVRRMAEAIGIGSAVTFLGWRDDIDVLIPLLDAVIMPSRYEGLPQVAVQAVTARVPVIGYAVDGLAELLPTGFKIPYGDENALAESVAAIVRGTKAWPSGEIGRRAEMWSDPDNAAGRLLIMLQSALQVRSRTPDPAESVVGHP